MKKLMLIMLVLVIVFCGTINVKADVADDYYIAIVTIEDGLLQFDQEGEPFLGYEIVKETTIGSLFYSGKCKRPGSQVCTIKANDVGGVSTGNFVNGPISVDYVNTMLEIAQDRVIDFYDDSENTGIVYQDSESHDFIYNGTPYLRTVAWTATSNQDIEVTITIVEHLN